jgi:probable HAF family extracellular repeat protein
MRRQPGLSRWPIGAVCGWLAAAAFLSALPACAGGERDARESSAPQASWKLTDLGTLGGKSSGAYAVNNAGTVVGLSRGEEPELDDPRVSSRRATHVFRWENGEMTSIGHYGWGSLGPGRLFLNEAGHVLWDEQGAGARLWDGHITELPLEVTSSSSFVALPTTLNTHYQVVGNRHGMALLWDNGRLHELGGGPGTYSTGVAINDDGVVVGYSDSVAGPSRAQPFTWLDGRTAELPLPAKADHCYPYALNARREVIGSCGSDRRGGDHWRAGVLWDRDGVHELRSPDGGPAFPVALNDRGEVTGTYHEGEDGLVWQQGNARELGPDISPVDINDRGQVVGTLEKDGTSHAFVWENGVLTDLGPRSRARSINNHGVIVGEAVRGNHWHAVLWRPMSGD